MSRAATLVSELEGARVVAVVTVEDPADATPLATALKEGGIRAIELTLRTPNAFRVLEIMCRAHPDLLVGAGTLLEIEHAAVVMAAGARFGLAPGLDATMVRHCAKIGLPFVPGVATPSDVQAALALGCRVLKFFPAEPLGGAKGLRILSTPFAHLGLRFLPLGGINLSSTVSYLSEPSVVAVGGSWIATPDLIRRRAWSTIHQRAEEAVHLISASSPVSA